MEKRDYEIQRRAEAEFETQFLRKKYRKSKTNLPEEIRGINIKDQELGREFTSAPRTYGGVTLNVEERALLTLPPKFATYGKVIEGECKSQIEKAVAKLRWEHVAKERNKDNNQMFEEKTSWRNLETNQLDFKYMRASDLPFNKRISRANGQ